MKLWQIIQWGNKVDGVDGRDTQCIISAIDMFIALDHAATHLGDFNLDVPTWKGGQADAVYLLGEDDKAMGHPMLIVPIWYGYAANLGKNFAWYYYHDTDEWKPHFFEI